MEKEKTSTPTSEMKINVPPSRNIAGVLAAMAVAEDLAKGHEVKIPSLGITLNSETTP